jgi:hypothetical protein
MMEFTRLEIKDILHSIDLETIDPDVHAKLRAAVGYQPMRQSPEAQRILDSEFQPMVDQDTAAALDAARSGQATTWTPLILTPAQFAESRAKCKACQNVEGFEGKHSCWTQIEVDVVNEQRRVAWETEQRMKERTPIVGEKNASNINADFAPPDGLTGIAPEANKEIGDINRSGHVCVKKFGPSNLSVYDCGNGHYYEQSRAVKGCPSCFAGGGAGGGGGETARDENAVEGEESF